MNFREQWVDGVRRRRRRRSMNKNLTEDVAEDRIMAEHKLFAAKVLT